MKEAALTEVITGKEQPLVCYKCTACDFIHNNKASIEHHHNNEHPSMQLKHQKGYVGNIDTIIQFIDQKEEEQRNEERRIAETKEEELKKRREDEEE